MPKTAANFFYYRLVAKNDSREKIDFPQILSNKSPVENTITINGDNGNGITYNLFFRHLEDGFFYGKIIRSRENKEFSTQDGSNWVSLHKKLGSGRTSENSMDHVHFVLGPNDKELLLLIQVGFQTSGGPTVAKFFSAFLGQTFKVSCKQLVTDKVRKYIDSLLKKKADYVSLKTKETDADLPDNEHFGIMRSLQRLDIEGFDIEIKFALNKLRENTAVTTTAGELFRKFFRISEDESVIDAVSNLDLAHFFYRIEVAAQTGVGVEKFNILRNFENEKISFDKSVLDMEESLIKELLAALREKINMLRKESE